MKLKKVGVNRTAKQRNINIVKKNGFFLTLITYFKSSSSFKFVDSILNNHPFCSGEVFTKDIC